MRPLFRSLLQSGLVAALAACATACVTLGEQAYVNPVLARDFPDPAVLRTSNGWFYAYATQSPPDAATMNIQVARSRDLVRWEHLGDALPLKPAWARTKQDFWAPHVVHDAAAGRYVMYYSAEPDAARGKCLAVATAAHPGGPFADAGSPLLCGEGIEHIDPMAFDDPPSGRPLLYWGSGAQGIKVQELSADRLSFRAGSAPQRILLPDPGRPYSLLVEGAWVIYRNATYYLFYSGDRCCGHAPNYAVMVARSRNPSGPFELFDREGSGSSAILEANGSWRGPGHNSVIADDEGHDWLLYHAVDASRAHFEDRVLGRRSNRVMLLDRIIYRDGWPRVGEGEPSVTPRDRPAMRGAAEKR